MKREEFIREVIRPNDVVLMTSMENTEHERAIVGIFLRAEYLPSLEKSLPVVFFHGTERQVDWSRILNVVVRNAESPMYRQIRTTLGLPADFEVIQSDTQ